MPKAPVPVLEELLSEELSIRGRDVASEGEILLYKQAYSQEKGVAYGQMLSSMAGRAKGGHYDTVSAAIATASPYTNFSQAHHFVMGGIYHEAVSCDERSYMIVSPKDSEAREKIARISEEYFASKDQSLGYDAKGATMSIFSDSTKSTEALDRNSAMYCSQFVMNVLKEALPESEAIANYSVNTSPRALESFLRQQPDFEIRHNLSKKGVAAIKDVINKQYTALLEKKDPRSIETVGKLKEAMSELADARSPHIDKVLKTLLPVFGEAHIPKKGRDTTPELQAIMKVATKQGYSYRFEVEQWIKEKRQSAQMSSTVAPAKSSRLVNALKTAAEGMTKFHSTTAPLSTLRAQSRDHKMGGNGIS